MAAPTFPGCVIEVRAAAMLRMRDAKGEDDKIVCVPHADPQWDDVKDLDDLPRQLRDEIEHFFKIYKDLEGDRVEVEDWHDGERALPVIEESRAPHAGDR